MRSNIWPRLAATALAASLTFPAYADITGTVDATITLTTGCLINGQSFDDGAGAADFGTIDFGTQNTLFTQADGQLLSGGGALAIQCSPGIAPTLSFAAGLHDGQGTGAGDRSMANAGAPGQYVTYNLYSDAGRTTALPVGGTIALDASGNAQTVDIYARAFGTAGLVAGSYSDVITIVLEL